ncbi:Hint domain-containing protein [Thalassobius sp. S69A]|uniref:Hint domain-containing protein n=1 Tax=unclassified Thalassovita TaxID=2619711 RepID=UPI003C7A0F11
MNKFAPVFDAVTRPSLTSRNTPAMARRPGVTRRYDISFLNDDMTPEFRQTVAPSLPSFEAAFSAFGRGLLLSTSQGPCAIEDLQPGMLVETVEHGPLPVQWIGSMQIIPNVPADRPELSRLVRIMADRFGIGRPVVDMILGPGARLLQGEGPDAIYVPAQDMVDGDGVFQLTPPAPTRVYHIALPQQATILAGGLQLESYHPGPHRAEMLGPEMLRLYLSLFPHVTNLSGFGSMAHPRTDSTHQLQAELY